VAPLDAIRDQFPALRREHQGHPVAYLDGPGGTQVPALVVDRMRDYLVHHNANTHWAYPTSGETDSAIADARAALADFLGAQPDEIAFGANMTTLTFHLSRALAREWQVGDEVIVTELDHHGNVDPWRAVARDRGLIVRSVPMNTATGELEWDALQRAFSPRTKLLAIGAASNILGTITDVTAAARLAHDAGALCFVDAVHYAPHALVDVRAIGCDLLVCSPYKFYGPHLGLAFVRRELLERWRPYKVRPAPGYETGTMQHELLAGFVAAVDYVESVGWAAIVPHERELGQRFLDGLPDTAQLHGLATMDGRVPTFALSFTGKHPTAVAQRLGERGIFVWDGDYYAVEVMQRLGLADGAVRVGFVHYNTADEVDRVLNELREL
jgi:cysteine desulfurase family protein (TIGR01976 family)